MIFVTTKRIKKLLPRQQWRRRISGRRLRYSYRYESTAAAVADGELHVQMRDGATRRQSRHNAEAALKDWIRDRRALRFDGTVL
jgi:hypothetical protein